jgi:hypothetical protein
MLFSRLSVACIVAAGLSPFVSAIGTPMGFAAGLLTFFLDDYVQL